MMLMMDGADQMFVEGHSGLTVLVEWGYTTRYRSWARASMVGVEVMSMMETADVYLPIDIVDAGYTMDVVVDAGSDIWVAADLGVAVDAAAAAVNTVDPIPYFVPHL